MISSRAETSTAEPGRMAAWVIPLSLTAFFFFLCIFEMGLSLGDDSWYLDDGAHFHFASFLFYQYWEPLYSLWLRCLLTLVPNPIWCYFVSWGLIVLAIALVPVALKTPRAWAYTFILVVFPFLTVGPYVALFASAIAVTATCLVLRRERSYSSALAAACLACFVIAYARAEYDYGVLLSAVATLVALVLERRRSYRSHEGRPRTVTQSLGLGLGVSVLAGLILLAMASSRLQRSGEAFAQHYNMRAVQRGLIPAGPDVWRSNYAEQVFHVDMTHSAADTGTSSIGQFLRANPKLFFGHVLSNVVDPKTIFLAACILLLLTWPWFHEGSRRLRGASLFLTALVIPPMLGIVTIYPRDHYAMVILPSLLIFALQLLKPGWLTTPSTARVLVVGIVLMLFMNVEVPRLRRVILTQDRIALRRVQCVRAVDETASPGTSAVFDTVSVRPVYLVHERTVSNRGTLPKWADFKDWATKTRPAWITVDPSLAGQYAITPVELDSFLRTDLGYTPYPCAVEGQLTVYAATR